MAKRPRGERRRHHSGYSVWHAVERIVWPLAVGYSLLVAGVLWIGWGIFPASLRTTLLWICGMNWLGSMLLLGIIRTVVWVRLVRPLQHRADYDALSGLYRADVFWTRAEELVQWLGSQGKPWAFVYLDLDDFKRVNDTNGHLIGDAVIRTLGSLLQSHARHSDITGRLGGEEFGWILPGASPSEAVAAANRLLIAFREANCDGLTGCTFSAGVAGWTSQEDSVSIWTIARRADHALYHAKSHGKGQVQITAS
ncbi:MAG: hypothetical protein C7B47_13190 [Sulfobacillus thermosulfidooxidans]|uniref:GGDEF domain-containing protein n=1 Tax=Sulfobacillus thermosulfidooxidans TaxID=28034 RepID=A0A2T2WSC2_SULTH|nr:MAG: hypothetical protein C7B47_13190 [Sulfobacillus thermosulfidooxidans]